eukprot:10028472-Alexandrium_andersonii.AAC.1
MPKACVRMCARARATSPVKNRASKHGSGAPGVILALGLPGVLLPCPPMTSGRSRSNRRQQLDRCRICWRR